MFLYNKGTDGKLYIMNRYHDSDTWDIQTLSLSMKIRGGYINEDGGVSLLYYKSDSPIIHFCHSAKRGDPLIYSTYTLESGSPWMHAFCQDGNFGILFSKSVGNNYIFVNKPSFVPCSVPGSKWIMYE